MTAPPSARLVGDESCPELDPRRSPILIKDLRAFTASILQYAGSTDLEASAMLRHRDNRTTHTQTGKVGATCPRRA